MSLFSAVKQVVDKHYAAQAAANCNTCSVGTWVVCHELHLQEESAGSPLMTFLKRLKDNRRAHAAARTAPTATAAQLVCGEKTQYKILVVCKDRKFSRGIADYAVDMARKTHSSLVAVNVDESGWDFEGFRSQAERDIEYFSHKASDAGLCFRHEIRQGDESAIVAHMHEQDPGFRYVMDDSAAVCKNRSRIPVYTRAVLRTK
ncbi:universal stress protein [Desulfovibrio sp. Fe33]|uniref:universal stress protein n=1 Tax=Desulfovibrio sp. Fe33 TaxID=3020842 RepID=UPI00234DDF73|nr:universal stress protein [Desulfovibrio sp. Fe33]